MFRDIVLDTINCIPIKQTAASLNLSIHCIFENRHKLLCALEQILIEENCELSGTIEFDETFQLENQKGCKHINRKARKRGGPSTYRGLSREQVCIVTTTDRNGHEIFKAVGFGKPNTNIILENFSGRLAENSVVYTDGIFCYDQLVKLSNCVLVQLKSHTSYNIVEHINTVNHIHSIIKNQLTLYRGLATKYMNRYMSLFVFIRQFQDMDNNKKLPILLRKLKTLHFNIRRESLKTDRLLFI